MRQIIQTNLKFSAEQLAQICKGLILQKYVQNYLIASNLSLITLCLSIFKNTAPDCAKLITPIELSEIDNSIFIF